MHQVNLINKALQIASFVHEGQVDIGGTEYLKHPLHICEQVESEDEKIVALLHDTLEDSQITKGYLLVVGFKPEIVEAVSLLTRKDGQSRIENALLVKNNKLACVVKIEDVKHNMDLTRLNRDLVKNDIKRFNQYREVLRILEF